MWGQPPRLSGRGLKPESFLNADAALKRRSSTVVQASSQSPAGFSPNLSGIV